MASRARQRAAWLLPREPVLGVACTASLATDRPKRGDHRFHLAIQTGAFCADYSLTLTKGARDRAAEEAVLDAALLNALAETLGLGERIPLQLLPGEEVQKRLPAARRSGRGPDFAATEPPFASRWMAGNAAMRPNRGWSSPVPSIRSMQAIANWRRWPSKSSAPRRLLK